MTTSLSQAILVLGMHRSGTSALSGALHLLGVPLGDSLIAADPVLNAKGYWEHSDITDINERILRKLGSSWLDESALPEQWWTDEAILPLREELVHTLRTNFEGRALWGVKDPRICRLLPLWMIVLDEVKSHPSFVIIARDPVETAVSLERRNGIHAWKSALLWLRYILDAEVYTRGYRRTFLTYEQLLRDWETRVTCISDELAVDWPVPLATARNDIASFLDGNLRHNNVATIVPAPDAYLDLARTAYTALDQGLDGLCAVRSRLVKELDEAADRNKIFLSQINECLLKIEQHAPQLFQLRCAEQEIQRVKATVSWRITKPLRYIANRVRKLR